MNRHLLKYVIPAKAGIQHRRDPLGKHQELLDSRLRGNDMKALFDILNRVTRRYIYWVLLFFLAACEQSGSPIGRSPDFSIFPITPLTIQDESMLIGGPAAKGQVGDLLMSNDQIRVVIQRPSKEVGIGSFGGNIIDADYGVSGKDQFGELFPLVNIEWTVNYYDFQVLESGKEGGSQVVRALGLIDVYDYLDLDSIGEGAGEQLGQPLYADDRFDDLRDPFSVHEQLKHISPEVITEYRLDPGKKYVQIDTTFVNNGPEIAHMPVGDFFEGGGATSIFMPGIGFTPGLATLFTADVSALVFGGAPGVDISYGYFYDLNQFLKSDTERHPTAAISFTGVTGIVLGEVFLDLVPFSLGDSPKINFEIPAESSRTITRYFVVGDGSISSVLDVGFEILKIETTKVSGLVTTSDGAAAAQAQVAIKKKSGGPVTLFRTDAKGKFSGLIPKGQDLNSLTFGPGKYEVWVDKAGYHANGTARSGICDPFEIDVRGKKTIEINCKLGETGVVELVGGVFDESGDRIPARLTILGIDPSPSSFGAGTFVDLDSFQRPYGIVDVKFINGAGGIGVENKKSINLEPGSYLFVFSHGTEYSIAQKNVDIAPGGKVSIEQIVLEKVIDTTGFIGADFHIHALPSPDSIFSTQRRALSAAAEGLDILQSSDHDYLTDYAPALRALEKKGILKTNLMQTIVGDEITPIHYGHLHAFPLTADPSHVDGGAVDWTKTPLDEISTAPDFVMSPAQIVETVLQDPGEEVIQINHISTELMSLPMMGGWLTTNAYEEVYGVPPMTSYADPVENRLASAGGLKPPYQLGGSEMIFTNFTAMELTIGPEFKENDFLSTALPTWFNFLNLGYKVTATGSSDSHNEIATPLGLPRNYILCSTDPRDGVGLYYSDIDEEEYAVNINDGRVIVSAGPFIRLKARNEKGNVAHVGDLIEGKKIELEINVSSPSWAWFDTIELYSNTEPIPSDDFGLQPFEGKAASPETFAKPNHKPVYIYDPVKKWRLKDESLKEWKEEEGVIKAKVVVDLQISEDSWVVVLVKGSPDTEGYKSLFPIVPDVLLDENKKPLADPIDLENFRKDAALGAAAWALTNPIYIDTDGDTNGDGNPFEAKWVE